MVRTTYIINSFFQSENIVLKTPDVEAVRRPSAALSEVRKSPTPHYGDTRRRTDDIVVKCFIFQSRCLDLLSSLHLRWTDKVPSSSWLTLCDALQYIRGVID